MDTILTAIAVVSGVVALFATFHKPINNFSIALEKNSDATKNLTTAVTELGEDLRRFKEEEKEEREKLWDYNHKQDKKIQEHEFCIRILKKEAGINGED